MAMTFGIGKLFPFTWKALQTWLYYKPLQKYSNWDADTKVSDDFLLPLFKKSFRPGSQRKIGCYCPGGKIRKTCPRDIIVICNKKKSGAIVIAPWTLFHLLLHRPSGSRSFRIRRNVRNWSQFLFASLPHMTIDQIGFLHGFAKLRMEQRLSSR